MEGGWLKPVDIRLSVCDVFLWVKLSAWALLSTSRTKQCQGGINEESTFMLALLEKFNQRN